MCNAYVAVSVQSTEPVDDSIIYYPRDHQTTNVSLALHNGSWIPVWDNSHELWLLNEVTCCLCVHISAAIRNKK